MGSKDNQPIDPPPPLSGSWRYVKNIPRVLHRPDATLTKPVGAFLSLSLIQITIRSIYDFFSPFDLLYNIMHTHTHIPSLSLYRPEWWGNLLRFTSIVFHLYPFVSLWLRRRVLRWTFVGGEQPNRFFLRRRQQVCRRRPSGETVEEWKREREIGKKW